MNPETESFPTAPESFDDHGSLDQVPLDVSHLAARPNEPYPGVTIGFRHAAKCYHTRIQNYQPPSYYEDYIMTASYSARMQELQADQARRLANWHEGRPASLVEIGCGDGSFLKHGAKHFTQVVGIEPSRRFADEARAAGFSVVEGYVGTERPLIADTKFDAFAARQVFEHLPDPVDVLRGIRYMLQPGAVGLIEVPNGFRALRRGRFYEFFPDHVQYYSANSLVGLATEAGLNVIECREAFGGDYLEMWLRYVPDVESAFQRLARDRDVVCDKLAGWLQECRDGGLAPLAVWGAGAKTLSILAARGALAGMVAYIIDSDPHKHGRFVPNTAIPILGPEQAAAQSPAALLILALSYREEIAALARRHLPGCRRIATLNDEGEVVSL